jgi:hypothetical protein
MRLHSITAQKIVLFYKVDHNAWNGDLFITFSVAGMKVENSSQFHFLWSSFLKINLDIEKNKANNKGFINTNWH